MKLVPVDAKRVDWPRLVADAIKALHGRASALEAPTTITFTPSSTPSAPTEGMTYMDSTTHKLRTYDGTAWQNHW